MFTEQALPCRGAGLRQLILLKPSSQCCSKPTALGDSWQCVETSLGVSAPRKGAVGGGQGCTTPPPKKKNHTQCGKCPGREAWHSIRAKLWRRLGVGWWVLSDGQEVMTSIMPAGVINDSDHSTYRALSASHDRRGNCGRERLRGFLSEAQPGGWPGPWALPADPSHLSRPRTMAQPCVACVKTPWKDCSFCCSSPSCLPGPWPPSSAACPAPGPSSRPGQGGGG